MFSVLKLKKDGMLKGRGSETGKLLLVPVAGEQAPFVASVSPSARQLASSARRGRPGAAPAG